jgi:FlaA1/EpsC-like NDP-sugar epimerase
MVARVRRVAPKLASPVEILLDVAAWTIASASAVYLRFDLKPSHVQKVALVKFIPLAAMVQIAVGMAVGLYRRRWRYGSFDEVRALVMCAVVSTGCLAAIDYWYLGVPRNVPLSAVVFGGAFGLIMMAGSRYAVRLITERRRRPSGPHLQRTIVYGAGESGRSIVTAMLASPDSPYLPVAFLDDDPAKRRLSINRIPVMGDRMQLVDVAAEVEADVLLIAMPSASSVLMRELADDARRAGLQVKVLPSVSDLIAAAPGVGDIRDLTDSDLLGRHQIVTDVSAIAGYLRGRRVLVTGAGGSIGSELCRQIAKFRPARLLMLDRDESALHAVQLSIEGRALLDDPSLILADLRDRDRVFEIFESERPDVVFHAAALKHLTLLEMYPAEAYKTNVVGTVTVLEAALKFGVQRLVNISTDKAANPASVLGYSKRLTERLTSFFGKQTNGQFLSVRFGNVLGSRGSVLTIFRAQVEAGGPITVTDPQVTRYFMTVQEAVQLVIQAGAIGSSGEILVLDMGEAVRIASVAERLAAESQRPIAIEYTGLRPGEKLHEDLFGDGESDVRPVHPLISHVPSPAISPIELVDPPQDRDGLIAWFIDRVGADLQPT